ncbi:unnamed protein product [Heterobilharzia americana]|nr:unnamed protein product [Heterobilharzia americana]
MGMNSNHSEKRFNETYLPVQFQSIFKYVYDDNMNATYHTQSKIINFLSIYKHLLNMNANHLVNRVDDTATTSCLNDRTSNYTSELIKDGLLTNDQTTLNPTWSTVVPFKLPAIDTYKPSQLGTHLSISNTMSNRYKCPHVPESHSSIRNSNFKPSNPMGISFSSSSSSSSFPLLYGSYTKSKFDSSVNSRIKPLISVNKDTLSTRISCVAATSVIMSSPSMSSSSKLSLSPSSSASSSPLSSSPSALSSDSMNPSSYVSKQLTVQILKRLARLPNHLGPYICRLCNQYFENALKLANHRCPLILHTDYRCPECDKVFSCPANLASHRRWHKPKSNEISEQTASVHAPSCSASHIYSNFANKKYFDCNYKKPVTQSKYQSKRMYSSSFLMCNRNAVVPHETQKLIKGNIHGGTCDTFHYNQSNQSISISKCLKKLNFSVQALLEDPFNNNDDNCHLMNNKSSIMDCNEKTIHSTLSEQQKYHNSSEINLNTVHTTVDDNKSIANYSVANITSSSIYNVDLPLTNNRTSIRCNYCNSVLSTQNLLESHMLQHIFDNLKSVNLPVSINTSV